MKKIIIILTTCFLLATISVSAQEYNNAIGLKFYPTGITFKHFFSEKISLEGIGYFYKYGTRITALYEINHDIPGVGGLGWYFGPGAHIGFFDAKYGGSTSFGVDGVLGLDYKIPSAPINLSLDFQPSIELLNNDLIDRGSWWGGLGIRFTF